MGYRNVRYRIPNLKNPKQAPNSAGAGIVCRWEEVVENVPLDEYVTIFQTKIVAILKCAQLTLEKKGKAYQDMFGQSSCYQCA